MTNYTKDLFVEADILSLLNAMLTTELDSDLANLQLSRLLDSPSSSPTSQQLLEKIQRHGVFTFFLKNGSNFVYRRRILRQAFHVFFSSPDLIALEEREAEKRKADGLQFLMDLRLQSIHFSPVP